MELVIERRTARGNEITDLALHPVLRRAYAARGVRDREREIPLLDALEGNRGDRPSDRSHALRDQAPIAGDHRPRCIARRQGEPDRRTPA